MHNETVNKFLIRNNINEEEIKKNLDTRILSMSDIDSLIEDFCIYKDEEIARISISDIYGFDYRWRGIYPNIFKALDSFFDENSNGYKARSCDNLLKTSEEMLNSDSFTREPMEVVEIDDVGEVYVIGSNGLHRYSALKVLYLNELYHHPEKELELKDKYKIPVSLSKIDKVKTYCNFIICSNISDSYIKKELDNNYQATGNSVLVTDDGRISLTDEELLSYTRGIIANNPAFLEQHSTNQNFKRFVEDVLYKDKSKEAHNG